MTAHAAALAAAGFVWIDLPHEKEFAWGDGRIDVALAERELPEPTEVFVREPVLRRDVIPAQRPELIEAPELQAAAGDETDVTLPEGGAPPLAPSICVDGGPFAAAHPRFSTYARPGAAFGVRLGRGRRGAHGDGSGTSLMGAISAAPALPEIAVAAPQREPQHTAARLVEHPPPKYPETARSRHVQGVVRLEAEVRADGSVGEVRVVESSGSKLLDDAAVAAVRRWTFEAATLDGDAVVTFVTLPAIRFELR